MHGFIQRVQRTIRQRQLLAERQPVVVACSGGPDSVALAVALKALCHPLTLANVDHGTRPGTALEARFVKELASTLGARFTALTTGPAGDSEDALRQARYGAFAQLPAGPIATGHTASDQAETVLLRLLRGAGTTGLSGIPPRRDRYIRPLLDATRSQVAGFLADVDQGYCIDPTNASLDPVRNRVRHELLPMLEGQFNPNLSQGLARLADVLRGDRAFLESAANAHLEAHGLLLEPLRAAHAGLLPHILRAASPVAMSFERIQAMLRLVHVGAGIVQLEGPFSVSIQRANGTQRVVISPTKR